MEVKYKKHVTIICHLNIGDIVYVENWGDKLDGRDRIIEDIKYAIPGSESGFLVKISGYGSYIDSGWLSVRETIKRGVEYLGDGSDLRAPK